MPLPCAVARCLLRWNYWLRCLLVDLSFHQATRLGAEARGQLKSGSKRLDPADTRLTRMLLDVCLSAMYSKDGDMVQGACFALRSLAFVHPKLVLPELVAQIEPALASLDQSHRMDSALALLAHIAEPLFARHVFPQGAQHLESLMQLSLPGIDATDPGKTAATLEWLSALFNVVPLADARHYKPAPAAEAKEGKGATEESENELDEAARLATFSFQEWSIAFLDRILLLLKNQDKVRLRPAA